MNDGLISYLSATAMAKNMLLKGIITNAEYAIFDTKLCEKYGLTSCSLYRDIPLLYRGYDGNMYSD